MKARAIGRMAAFYSGILILVSLIHAHEDFAFGEPARLGISKGVSASVLVAAYAAQLLGIWLALRGDKRGGWIIAATGVIWVVGAFAIHGPEVAAQGLKWRDGLYSIVALIAVVFAGVLVAWSGRAAALAAARSE